MLYFAKSHEWANLNEDGTATIGISDYAQNELGDLVFVNLPEVGDELSSGEVFADVESVKAVSDVYSPISGTVEEINENLLDNPALINESAYDAWFVRVSNATLPDGLMTKEEYEHYLATL
ncbi:MAG: glycine cleavage system protein GcvH [Eubacteriales bacterium]|nr:glycine cleavage system protein GcvH [Eubacteriales bacterium]